MKPILSALVILTLILGFTGTAPAADSKEATAVIDKAIKALGGQEKLAAIKAAVVKIKGKVTINGEDSDFNMTITVQGLDHAKQEFSGNFGGNEIKHAMAIAGDKGWQRSGEDEVKPLDDAAIAGYRRNFYLQMAAINPTLVKDKAFKIDSSSDAPDGKSVVVKIIGPDDKDFTIFFDKETSLPVKSVGRVLNYMGTEVNQETVYSEYKETNGIKSATHAIVSHDGEKLMDQQTRELKVLDKADDAAFAEPK